MMISSHGAICSNRLLHRSYFRGGAERARERRAHTARDGTLAHSENNVCARFSGVGPERMCVTRRRCVTFYKSLCKSAKFGAQRTRDVRLRERVNATER